MIQNWFLNVWVTSWNDGGVSIRSSPFGRGQLPDRFSYFFYSVCSILAAWTTATSFWFLNDLKYVITVPYELFLYPITIWETILSCLCAFCEQRWGRFCSKLSSQECLCSKQSWKTECLPAGQRKDLSVPQVNKNNPMGQNLGRLPLKEGHFPSSGLLSCDKSSQHRHNLSGQLRNGLPWTWW